MAYMYIHFRAMCMTFLDTNTCHKSPVFKHDVISSVTVIPALTCSAIIEDSAVRKIQGPGKPALSRVEIKKTKKLQMLL